jgi:hypothetical protein
MKTPILFILVLMLFVHVAAGDPNLDTNQWGPLTNYVRLSIALKDDPREIKTNEPFALSFLLQNLSTNNGYYFLEAAAPDQNSEYSFSIVLPSGQTSNIDFHPTGIIHTAGHINVPPNGLVPLDYWFSEVFHPREFGTYRITTTIIMNSVSGSNYIKVISNPFTLVVAPGKWTPPTNKPAPSIWGPLPSK